MRKSVREAWIVSHSLESRAHRLWAWKDRRAGLPEAWEDILCHALLLRAAVRMPGLPSTRLNTGEADTTHLFDSLLFTVAQKRPKETAIKVIQNCNQE